MAKKVKTIDAGMSEMNPYAKATTRYEGEFVGDLTGDVIGNVTGNADTATSLAAPFTVTVTGDATGSFATAGKNSVMRLTVTNSKNSEFATLAESAKSTQNASLAQHSTSAMNADYAREAGTAVNAQIAQHALTADSATNAGKASLAVKAQEANHAALATQADTATTANRALTADVALALKNDPDNPVPRAKFAERAGVAQIAQYDCMGRSITDTYALKSELVPYEDMLTEKEANHLYLTREEKITQAVVRGRAYGSGYVDGNTLRLFIESICSSGDEVWNIYNDFLVNGFPEDKYDADTTKMYADKDGVVHYWDHEDRDWKTIKGLIPDEEKAIIEGYIEQIKDKLDEWTAVMDDVVTIHGDQSIEGNKVFNHLVETPIADIDNDDPRTVVVAHNLKDVRDKLRAEFHELCHHLYMALDKLEDRVDAQQNGDFLIGKKDYTVPENQVGMATHTVYINYLDINKQYIAVDDAGKPIDPSREIMYLRFIMKLSNGQVVWRDVKHFIDPNLWVPWDPVYDDEGNVVRRDIKLKPVACLKSEDSTGANRNLIRMQANDIINAGDSHNYFNITALDGRVTINGKEIVATDKDLEGYVAKTGDTMTGDLHVPDIPLATQDTTVFNSKRVHELIDQKLANFGDEIDLDQYMPKAGGDFTGPVTVPNAQPSVAEAGDKIVLNKRDILELIKTEGTNQKWLRLVLLDYLPADCADLEEDILYAVPIPERDLFDTEIFSIRVEPDDSNATPEEGEGVAYGIRDQLP